MTVASPTESSHLLSVLIFSPLLAAVVAACLRNERLLRLWTLAFTSAVALFSLQLWWRFDAKTADFQFIEFSRWIPVLEIHYAVGIDGMVDGFAQSIRRIGQRLRFAQRGQMQQSLAFAFAVAAILIIAFLWYSKALAR